MVQSALPVSQTMSIRSITSSHSTIPKPLVDKVAFSIQSARLIDEQFRNDFEGICRYLVDYDISISQATSSHVRKDRSSINIELANPTVAYTLQDLNKKS